jgi:hypothetical protein
MGNAPIADMVSIRPGTDLSSQEILTAIIPVAFKPDALLGVSARSTSAVIDPAACSLMVVVDSKVTNALQLNAA